MIAYLVADAVIRTLGSDLAVCGDGLLKFCLHRVIPSNPTSSDETTFRVAINQAGVLRIFVEGDRVSHYSVRIDCGGTSSRQERNRDAYAYQRVTNEPSCERVESV
jgi:hypothetical protein